MESLVDARARGCVSLALIMAPACPQAAGHRSETDPASVAISLVDARADQSLDEALLLELNELLLDPVDLGRDDVSRLRVLPWLGPEQLDALRSAKAPTSAVELAALPGWNVEHAQRTRAFVRFASPQPAIRKWPRGGVRTALLRRRRDVLLDASARPLRVVARWTSLPREPVGYALAVQAPGVRLTAGDVRARHAQGLLWWSGEDRLRAASSALRAASGVLPSASLDRERVVRGTALEAGGVVQACVLVGAASRGRVALGTVGVRPARLGLFEAGVVRTRRRSWLGGAWSTRTRHAGMALEAAGSSGRAAMLAAAAWQVRRISVRARLEHASAGSLSPWSVASPSRRRSASRQALLQFRLHRARTRVEIAAAHESRRDSLGTRMWSVEHSAILLWSQQPLDLELRLRQRKRRENAVGLESFADASESRTRFIVVRVRKALQPPTWAVLEYRAVETRSLSGARTETGSAWLLQLGHRAGSVSARCIISSFSAPSGLAAPYVPEPYMAGTFSSVRLLGDGVRVASGVSIGEQQVRFRVRGACVFRADGVAGLDLEMSLSIRLR